MKRQTVFSGDDVISIELPDDTEILEPPGPKPALKNPADSLREALENPDGSPPLAKLIKSTDRITIAFDDPCLPIPLLKEDFREMATEVLVQELFKIGVKKERIRLICANGLHRKWNEKELEHILGKRILKEFRYGELLTCHDGEDGKNLVHLGKTGAGEEVEVNRAVVESDLTIYLNTTWTSMNGGWKSIAVGLGSYRGIRHHHNPSTLCEGGSLLDPETSGMHKSLKRMGKLIEKEANVFQIESVLNNNLWDGMLSRHFDLGLPPSPLMNMARRLPQTIKDKMRPLIKSSYGVISVNAGRTGEVHKKSLESLFMQQNIRAHEPYDIVIAGLPNLSPYSSFSLMNPLLVMNLGLGYVFNFYRGRPFVKKGGVLILLNPCDERFHPAHHLPYIEFYEKVLSQTKDPQEINKNFEKQFAVNERYIKAYRSGFSYHGSHPFFVWYWGARALKHLGLVIIANAKDPNVPEKMGFTPARDIQAALNLAKDFTGGSPSIALLKMPPVFAVDIAKQALAPYPYDIA